MLRGTRRCVGDSLVRTTAIEQAPPRSSIGADETEQYLACGLVGPVARDRRRGTLRGLPELRLSEELDESGRDVIWRSFDRQADAGTEFDDAPGVELLVASKR